MTLAFDLPATDDSFARRLDPRWKLVSAVLAGIVILCLGSLPALLLAFAGCLGLIGACRIPWRWYARRVLPLLPLLIGLILFLPLALHDDGPHWLLFGRLRFSEYGFWAAMRLVAKALGVTTLTLFLIGSTPLVELFKAMQALRAPRLFVFLLSLALRHLLLLGEEFGRLRVALRTRGFRNRADVRSYRVIASVTGTLLVRSLERAERVGQAMRCRGFDRSFRSLHSFQTARADVVYFVLVAGTALAVLAADWLAR